MAKEMLFDAPDGVTHSASYWIPAQIDMSKIDGCIGITFYGYKDKTTRDARKSPVGQKSYVLSGMDFIKYFDVAELNKPNVNLISQCYKVSEDIKDTDKGTKDVNGKEIMESFFKGAADV